MDVLLFDQIARAVAPFPLYALNLVCYPPPAYPESYPGQLAVRPDYGDLMKIPRGYLRTRVPRCSLGRASPEVPLTRKRSERLVIQLCDRPSML